jgi:hypothetical protein
MKIPTLYVPIVHKVDQLGRPETIQLISVKNVKEITEKLPSYEVIIEHLKLEKFLVKDNKKNGKKYIPRPYDVFVSQSEYKEMIDKLRKKVKGYRSNFIYLMYTSKSQPIIKISIK